MLSYSTITKTVLTPIFQLSFSPFNPRIYHSDVSVITPQDGQQGVHKEYTM